MSIDVLSLWDFSNPELSEQRFRCELESASSDVRLILMTQIARTYGLRKRFDEARGVLAAIEPEIEDATDEVRLRYRLELGRSYCSPAHDESLLTDDARTRAKQCYEEAFHIGERARLDYLAVDALHMMAMVFPDPAEQLEWDLKTLAYMEGSDQIQAKKWEPSLRNNVGYALHQAGRYEEALKQFELALELRVSAGSVQGIRTGYWMIAWTLRSMARYQEALDIQLRMEKEWDADEKPSPYVYEELEHLYRAIGDEKLAAHNAALRKALSPH